MRKLIACVLLLALLLPSAVFALDGNSPFFGNWVGEEHHKIKHYDIVLHYIWIHENTPCSYMVFQIFYGGMLSRPKLEDPEMYTGNWEIEDDHLRIPTSGISYIDVYYDKDTDTLYTEDPKVTYVRIP